MNHGKCESFSMTVKNVKSVFAAYKNMTNDIPVCIRRRYAI